MRGAIVWFPGGNRLLDRMSLQQSHPQGSSARTSGLITNPFCGPGLARFGKVASLSSPLENTLV